MAYKAVEPDEEVIERIRRTYGNGWFSSHQVKVRINDLKRLVVKGYLEMSRMTLNHLLVFRIKGEKK
jgi:hypothetical protein